MSVHVCTERSRLRCTEVKSGADKANLTKYVTAVQSRLNKNDFIVIKLSLYMSYLFSFCFRSWCLLSINVSFVQVNGGPISSEVMIKVSLKVCVIAHCNRIVVQRDVRIKFIWDE